ncbi:MAG: SDR family NAD(P)-dependent oxidoreductase [Opitutales bacterium]|jgi:3-oxoacyl-[acyl-carrier protein] reductase
MNQDDGKPGTSGAGKATFVEWTPPSAKEPREIELVMAPAPRRPAVALVTGTSQGLGRALAEKLLADGWIVHGFARGEQTLSHERFRAHVVDVTDEAAVRAAVAFVAEAGRIDLLVNNAGAASMNAFLLTPGAIADSLMRVNYLGAFHCLQAAGRVMVRQRAGLVVNLTTVAVPLSLEGEAAYVASKAAVEALTKVAAKELASQGVRVIALGFGPIDTRLTRAVPATALAEVNHAIGRPQGTTMAQAVEFILSRIHDADLKSGGVEYLGEF